MNVIFKPRKQGKTTDIINRAADIDGQIITNTVKDAAAAGVLAEEMDVKIRKPISIRLFNLNSQEIIKNKVPILIDDAEYVLQYLLNSSLAGTKLKIDTLAMNDDMNTPEELLNDLRGEDIDTDTDDE